MKRQIFLFHIVSLVLAMLFLLAVNGSVFHLTLALYQSQEVPASDSRSNQVQGTLDQWPEHSKDWKELNRHE